MATPINSAATALCPAHCWNLYSPHEWRDHSNAPGGCFILAWSFPFGSPRWPGQHNDFLGDSGQIADFYSF